DHILDRLRGDLLHVVENRPRAAGVVRVDNDEVIAHFDDNVIAMAGCGLALAKPDARGDRLERGGPGVGPPGETCQEEPGRSSQMRGFHDWSLGKSRLRRLSRVQIE